MITYPITLKSDPEQPGVLHRFELVEGSTEGDGFELISTWLQLPSTKDATDVCPFCGATLELPDGSLEAHLKRYQAEHGGQDKIVRIVHSHKGPAPHFIPPGWTVADEKTDRSKFLSFKEYIQLLKSSEQKPAGGMPMS
jgi:hypothetical protein